MTLHHTWLVTLTLTGLGALNYLDENAFLAKGIDVMCMNYRFSPWKQFYGPFTPYVTALDCLAHCGPSSKAFLQSECVSWQYAMANQSRVEAAYFLSSSTLSSLN